MPSKTRYRSKLKLVAIDETANWDEKIVKKTGKIEQVYIYDEAVTTYYAELSPSYYLTPLYFRTEKRMSDQVHEDMMMEPAEEIYAHCSQVDAMERVDVKKYKANFRFTNPDNKFYRDKFEEAREYFSRNHVM